MKRFYSSLVLLILVSTAFAQGDRAKGKRRESAQDRELSISTSTIKSGASMDGRGRLWAVVIGVSNYRNLRAEEQLRFAHRDAESLAAFLRSPEGGGFPSHQIKLLINEQATLAAVRTALGTWLARSAEKEDVVYIFFAGHGVVEGEDAYLLAHDSDPQNLYATSLAVAEIDRVITERVESRVKILIADACHAGKIGLQSRGAREELIINRFLDEVGKSGAGTFRLLASRENEKSFEDERWGGGHGVFTHFLLEGLGGRGDRDRDGVVRAGELLDYLSEVVPAETQAAQHPRAAGNLDARLPLSIVRVTETASLVALEVRGAAGSEVYLDSSYRGRIPPNGTLAVAGIKGGDHEISIDEPSGVTIKQMISLSSAKTVLDVTSAARSSTKGSPLAARIRESMARGNLTDENGAWSLYEQMVRQSPDDPQRAAIEIELSGALEETGQQSINNYVRSSEKPFDAERLRRASASYERLRQLKPEDSHVEAKRLFAAARVLLAEGKAKEAIDLLERSLTFDSRTACPYNALGVAYEKTSGADKAAEFYNRAAVIAPGWALPRYRLGLQHYARGRMIFAMREFKASVQLDPAFLSARWWLARACRSQGRLVEAEREALELIRIAPNYAPAHLELGLIYEAKRQWAKAGKAFETYLRLTSLNAKQTSTGL